jgi:hypothetical protein
LSALADVLDNAVVLAGARGDAADTAKFLLSELPPP